MRHAFHVAISLLMWGLFGYYWYVVSGREISQSSIQSLGILSLVIAGGLIITFWWVVHNLRIARRNQRRTSPPTVPEPFVEDYLQRLIIGPDISVLKQAKIIDVSLDEEQRKIYASADLEVADGSL